MSHLRKRNTWVELRGKVTLVTLALIHKGYSKTRGLFFGQTSMGTPMLPQESEERVADPKGRILTWAEMFIVLQL